MLCPKCHANNSEDRRFCRQCAAPLPGYCPACGFANEPGDLFCGGCGEKLALVALADEAEEASGMPHGAWKHAGAERRHITVMFCDLVGSAAITEQLDPEDMRDLLSSYHAACGEIINRYAGSIAQYQGDGILVYFGYPQAHEDDAVRAIRSGLEMIPKVQALSERWFTKDEPGLDVRIGIDTGLVVVGGLPSGAVGQDMAVVGEAPNVASRVQNFAEPGSLLITGNTMRLVEGLFVVDDLGPQEFRNIAQPVNLYRVRRVSEKVTRFEAAAVLTPFVDRERELALILDHWERVRAGDGQVVMVSGEPGIGKSRLIREVHERIAGEPHIWLRCQCSPYFRQSALFSVIVGLSRRAELRIEDSPEEKLAKLERFLRDSDDALEDVVPLLASLLNIPISDRYQSLSLSPERQKELTFQALIQLYEFMGSRTPLVLLFEDVHWIDPTSLELIERLIPRVTGRAILLVVVFRPEFKPPWEAPQSTVHLVLGRLSESTSVTLIENLVGGKSLPVDLQGQLVARSEGIPLFVEEITKSVIESGVVEETDDSFVLSGQLPSSYIPATLQESLLARLERLAPIKEVAQFASAIGRDFSFDLLAEITPLTRVELQAALSRLEATGFIFRLHGPPPVSYSFKHALVRDAAYDSMLHSRRHQLHGLIADALRSQFGPTVKQHPELLALHQTAAGSHSEAIEAWLSAGLRAIERSDTLEAVAHLRAGIDLIPELSAAQSRTKLEIRLQTALGAALRATQGFAAPAVVRAFERARTLCTDLKDEELLLDVFPGLQSYYHVQGRLRTARELGEQLITLSEQRPEETHRLLDARRRMGWSLFWMGELAEAGDYLKGALSLYDPKEHQLHIRLYEDHPGLFSHCNLAWVRWCQGQTGEADRHSVAALKLAEDVDHLLSWTYGTCVIGALFAARGDAAAARELSAKAVPFAEDKGFPYWAAWAHIIHGWALTRLGVHEQGMAELSRGIDAYAATGAELVLPFALGLLVDARLIVGEHEGADIVVEEALQRTRDNEIYMYEPELLRQKGRALLAAGAGLEAAEKCFRQAVEIAAHQGAYFFELRAVTALAQAYLDAGRGAEALNLLDKVRSGCPDPRINSDLQQADKLLVKLKHL